MMRTVSGEKKKERERRGSAIELTHSRPMRDSFSEDEDKGAEADSGHAEGEQNMRRADEF